MALTATIYVFDINLADSDRGVYETFNLRVARHPSESETYLVTRLMAYCLEYGEGIAFGRGLSDPDEPPIAIRDLTGQLQAWIEVGAPEAARVHKAAKAAPRVAVYAHRDAALLARQWAGERIHNILRVRLVAIERDFLNAMAAKLDRRMTLDVSVSGGTLYVSTGKDTLTGTIAEVPLGEAAA